VAADLRIEEIAVDENEHEQNHEDYAVLPVNRIKRNGVGKMLKKTTNLVLMLTTASPRARII
jgi:hypothetical protein